MGIYGNWGNPFLRMQSFVNTSEQEHLSLSLSLLHCSYICIYCIVSFLLPLKLTTTIARRVPILRHVLGWLGSSLATPSIAAELLDSGLKIAIVPGGVAEVFYLNEEDEVSELDIYCSPG